MPVGINRDLQNTVTVVVCFAPRWPRTRTVRFTFTLSLSAAVNGFALPELPRLSIRLSTRNRKDNPVSSRRCLGCGDHQSVLASIWTDEVPYHPDLRLAWPLSVPLSAPQNLGQQQLSNREAP